MAAKTATLIDETGKKHGYLTVICRAESRKSVAYWLCQCVCGKTWEVRQSDLRDGSVKSCGCCGRAKDETGNRFGKLVVLKHVKTDYRGWHWLCQCDCGNQTVVVGGELRRGTTYGCGCNRIIYPKGEAASRETFSLYKKNAKKRGIDWQLTLNEFLELTQGTCHYCGAKPTNEYIGTRLNGSYIYNGIDRKNNDLGYTKENTVSCCKRCNFAKRDASYRDFVDYLDRLVSYRAGGKICGS